MGYRTRNPHRQAGALINSGNLDTGEVRMTRGGERAATIYSGAIAMGTARGQAGAGVFSSGGSVFLISGGGRLNSFTALWPAAVALAGNGENAVVSGQPIVVYDAGITARSGVFTDGTLSESGARILFAWAPPKLIASGALVLNPHATFNPQSLDIPFYSGLCVMALSGATGFNLTYTPEASRSGGFTDEVG